jgi:ABC-2 type transport system permease protein
VPVYAEKTGEIIMKHLKNIYDLGIKELFGLLKDKVLLVLLIYTFTFGIYTGAKSMSSDLRNAPIAFVDEDRSVISNRIISACREPYFMKPELVSFQKADTGLEKGEYTFSVNIPHGFEKDLISGKQPEIQVNIDATALSQAGLGAVYLQNIILNEVNTFIANYNQTNMQLGLSVRIKYNPNLETQWFGGVSEMINNIAMFSILLTGAALIREREHGTLEHLLVMPLSAFEIMMSKVWSMGLAIMVMSSFSLFVILKLVVGVPIAGSSLLFLTGAMFLLLATTSLGIFMGTVARSMPQFGLIAIITILPLMMLSGSITPYESMPVIVQKIMYASPTTHFIAISQGIIFRGAGIAEVWREMLFTVIIGIVFFILSLLLFRKSLRMQ